MALYTCLSLPDSEALILRKSVRPQWIMASAFKCELVYWDSFKLCFSFFSKVF